jgi:hypothetical protein
VKPDEKYMSQVNLNNEEIKFVPPSFIFDKFRDDVTSNSDNNMNLDLFPSETGLPELCYYSNESENFNYRNDYANINTAKDIIPTTFDVLSSLDFELDEKDDLERSHYDNNVNKIYSKIERGNPGIFATLYSYRIPRPIARVIVKRLIRLTLSYCDKKNNH